MFKRQYQYVCSSDKCPSKFFEIVSAEDFVIYMTLHEPKEDLDLSLERSIKEWESGCSGWRNVSNIVFSNYPPFLVFDSAASFRDKIKSLNDTPRQIAVYI